VWKRVGQTPPRRYVENFEGSAALASVLDLVEQKILVPRESHRFDSGVRACVPFGRVNEQLIDSIYVFAHVDAGLLLTAKSFAEDVPASDTEDGIDRFNINEFLNAFPNALATWNSIEIVARGARLGLKPRSRFRRVLLFKPAVRVADGKSVVDVGNGFHGRNRRQFH
jgi:hypothetical protein